MLRRYPYWGWLLLSLLLWICTGYLFHTHRQAVLPDRMARAVNNDLHRRQDVFAGFMREQDVINRMFTGALTEKEEARINAFPFYIYGYHHDSLRCWNTNVVIANVADSLAGKTVILKNDRGVFVQQSADTMVAGIKRRLVVLFPIQITYPLENDYLNSRFVASSYIPLGTHIVPATTQVGQGYAVTNKDGNTIFYIRFNKADIQKWVPNSRFIMMLIAALLATISWLQLMIIYLTRKRSALVGFIITLGIIIILRSLLFFFGVPFNLDTLTFFSPLLYASSKYLSSFGDLFIATLCILWLVVFITRHTPYKTYLENRLRKPFCIPAAIVLFFILNGYLLFFVAVIRSLVLDSSISFDISHFTAVNIYTVFGLMEIGTITGISCLIIYLFNIQFKALIKNRWLRYVLLVLTGAIVLWMAGYGNDPFYWILLGWMLLFVLVLDIRNMALVSDLLQPHMIFWALFICLFCTGILQYFNHVKEREGRRAFVDQHLAPHRDNVMEYDFDKKAAAIERDKIIKTFFDKPLAQSRKIIDRRFDTLYLNGSLAKYQARVFLYDADGRGLFNKDSADYLTLANEKKEAITTSSPYLFYKESIIDRNYYLAYIRMYSDTINNVVGYVIIDLKLKKQAAENGYNELLQSNANRITPLENEYAYAIYINDKLISQTGDFPFTTYLHDDTLKEQQNAFYNHSGESELYYKVADNRTIVVVHHHSEFIESVTVFSYIFGVLVLLAIVILVYQFYLSYFGQPSAPGGKFIRLDLRKRVHLSMLSIVLISFAIIGSVTVIFSVSKYRSSNSEKLQSAMLQAKTSIQDYLKSASAYETPARFDSISKSSGFKNFITILASSSTLANSQKIDINIYDDKGVLFSTSQDEVYDKGLISRMMRPDAFYQLNVSGKSIVIQDEQIAGLSYLSAYEPMRDEHGTTLGYINVPFFASEKDLKSQVSNIVITLINLYACIFLISSVITVLIIRWITGSFDIIIKQFARLNLQRNERISWPHDDEIGLLVKEYNKMVNKVEENAMLLAKSERESAWREMARQVAHEIKNPLTPMKLNIQYLQQAVRNDSPNIKELTNKVADSIVEQINNLSYIASEFSNFATMPEARPEILDPGELLHKAVELFRNDGQISITLTGTNDHLRVYTDRSQLLRVFTNLLQNARQAIPEGRAGSIDISVTQQDDDVIIAIADNGEGISEEVARKIFEPYFTTKSSGTGLGLAMTRKIIEFWKGRIWFESTEGIGTTFYIKLPITNAEQ